jgi:putative addiction module killer protein
MIEIRTTNFFDEWYESLKDKVATKLIWARIRRAQTGHFGDSHQVDGDIYEMRIHYGQGYRLYYWQSEKTTYCLLVGSDKGTDSEQKRDIAKAKAIRDKLIETGLT